MEKIHNYFKIPQKNYKYTSKYRQNFLSDNWKYWSNLIALATVFLYCFFRFDKQGAPRDMNNYFRDSTEIFEKCKFIE